MVYGHRCRTLFLENDVLFSNKTTFAPSRANSTAVLKPHGPAPRTKHCNRGTRENNVRHNKRIIGRKKLSTQYSALFFFNEQMFIPLYWHMVCLAHSLGVLPSCQSSARALLLSSSSASLSAHRKSGGSPGHLAVDGDIAH